MFNLLDRLWMSFRIRGMRIMGTEDHAIDGPGSPDESKNTC